MRTNEPRTTVADLRMSSTNPTHGRSTRFVYALTSAGIVTALAFFAWRGWYARYLTDDYCTASLLQTLGFFDAMAWHRQNWSGRFSYFPLKAVFESFGAITAQITPTVMIVLLFASAFAALRIHFRGATRLGLTAVSLAVVFTIVDGSPSLTNIGGSLYWETGSVTYLPPLMLILLWSALFSAQMRVRAAVAVSVVMMFVAGGMSETSLAAQGAMTGAAFVAALLFRSRRATWIAGAGLAATLLALVTVATAPGNAVRTQIDVVRRPFLDAATLSLHYADAFIGTYTFAGGLSFLTLILVTFVFVSGNRRIPPRVALAVAVVALCSYVTSFLPSSLLLPTGPPERALDVPNFFLIAAVFAATIAGAARTGELTSRRARVAAALSILLLYAPWASVRDNLVAIPYAREIAVKTDEADRILRASRGKDVALKAPWALSMRIFHPQTTHWTSRCVSRYYGLNSFHATR